MSIILFFILILSSTIINHADISKLRAYPSGIIVSFKAPEVIISEKKDEKPQKKPRWAWQRRKLEREEAARKALLEAEALKNPPKLINYKRFLRIINSTSLKEDEYASLDFYNTDDDIISQHTITNTKKPTPRDIFFMDRVTGRQFKGYFDNYHIPVNAEYFKVNFYTSNKETLFTAKHPDFEKKDRILISQYYNLSPKQKIMIQIEVLGSQTKPLTRIGGFYFP